MEGVNMAQSKEIGQTGLANWGGQIHEEFMRELRGKEGYTRYNEMRRNSPVIAAMLAAIKLSVRSAEWNVTSDQGEDDPRVEFVTEAMDGMSHSFSDHISESLTFLPFGFSTFEIVYKRENLEADTGRIVWRKFAPRGQDTVERWEISDDGGIDGFYQTSIQGGRYRSVFLPIEKLILYRTDTEKNNPEGVSILRPAWTAYYFWKNISAYEGIGVERDAAGMPVITMPAGATTSGTGSDFETAKKLVRRVRNDEEAGIVLQEGWEFRLEAAPGSKQFDTDIIIKRYESRMLMAALAQFLMLGQDRVGALSLSQDQTDFFNMSVNVVADIIAETFTQHAIPRLLKLNGMDPKGVRLEHSPVGDVNLEILGKVLQATSDKLTWLPDDEVWLRGAANLPAVEMDRLIEERDKKAEIGEQLRRQFAQGNNKPGAQDDAEDNDEMTADLYAASEAPDDDERRRLERTYERMQKAFFSDQYDRILKAAKAK